MKTAEEEILEIKEKINRQIIDNIACNEDLNVCSWDYQTGVLITTNDAEKLLEYASLKEDKVSLENAEDVWDKMSEKIGTDIVSLDYYAGKEVITKESFLKICSLLPSPPKIENK